MLNRNSLPVLLGLAALFLPGVSSALTRTVPTQFSTIQAALNASANGDSVAVLPGTYVENLTIDRAIVLRSTGGPAVTVIDGSSNQLSTVKMSAGEVTGFDIRNGSGIGSFQHPNPRVGGGVYVFLFTGTATVQENWIHDNVVAGERADGGGVWADGNVLIRNNRIYRNRVEATVLGSGSGIKANGTIVEGNEIFANHVEHGNAALYCFGVIRHNIVACNSVSRSPAFPTPPPSSGVTCGSNAVEGNTIVENWGVDLDQYAVALRLYANRCTPPCPTNVFGNVVAFNLGDGVECILDNGGDANFGCNDIYGNTGEEFMGSCGNPIGQGGNMSVDPQFAIGTRTCPYAPGDFCLDPDSPLLPENSPPGCGLIGAVGECAQIGIADAPPSSQLRSGPASPNPFAERTSIPFYLPQESSVEIAIVDVKGRRIRGLEVGPMIGGEQRVEWDGRTDEGARAASGAYIAVIRAGDAEITQTLLLLR